MVTNAFFGMIAGFFEWINSFWGDFSIDFDWLHTLDAQIHNILQWSSGLGVWMDWGVVNVVVASIIATWLICFTVKLVLRIVSHFPQFGGAG